MSDNIQHPKVFISYSWDSEEHKKWVLALSNDLNRDGIDCQIDQYVTFVEEGWTRWMKKQIEVADFVLLVCTQKYHDRFDKRGEGGAGRGVAWEAAISTQNFYDDFCRNKRFIPVLPDKVGEVNHIPTELRDYPRFFIPSQYEDLLRLIMGRPKIIKPQPGEPPLLPPEPFVSLQEVDRLRNEKATQKVEITETQNIPCAVILTAIPEEYKAIRTYLVNIQEVAHSSGTLYEVGHFSFNDVLWKVGIVQIEKGNDRAAFEAERAIDYFEPTIAMFVGVAGGIKDVQLGDVVVATKVYGYESGKQEETFMARPEVGYSDYGLQQIAQSIARQEQWWEPWVKLGSRKPKPRAFVGPIAAGNKVVASTRSTLYEFLRNTYNDALAVEMEGIGFMQAVHANKQVAAIIVRGISDLIDKKSEADKAGSQRIAVRNASAFAFQMLIKKGEILSSDEIERLRNEKAVREAEVAVEKQKLQQLEEKIVGLEQQVQSAIPPQFEEAIKWLANRKELANSAGNYALNQFPELKKDTSPRTIKRFYQDLEDCLELIYYRFFIDRLTLLDEPNIPLSLPVEVYKTALRFLQQRIPPRIADKTEEVRNSLEYLMSRLSQ